MGIADRDYYREDSRWHNPFARAQVTVFLVVTFVAMFVAQHASQPVRDVGKNNTPGLTSLLELNLSRVADGEVWRLLSYALVHDEERIFSLVFTVIIMLWIARQIEDLYGNKEFLALFLFSCLLGGAVFAVAGLAGMGEASIMRGPSVALFTLFVLYVLHFPGRTVNLFIPVPVWAIGLVLVVVQAATLGGRPDNAASVVANLSGAVFAFAYHRFSLRVSNWLPARGRSVRRPSRSKSKLRIYQEQPGPRPEPAAASVGAGATNSSASDMGGLDEHLEAKLDEVLEKVNKLGRASLTESEQQVLMRASEIYKKRRQSH